MTTDRRVGFRDRHYRVVLEALPVLRAIFAMTGVVQGIYTCVHDSPVRKLAGMLNNGSPLFHSLRMSTFASRSISCKLVGHRVRLADLSCKHNVEP